MWQMLSMSVQFKPHVLLLSCADGFLGFVFFLTGDNHLKVISAHQKVLPPNWMTCIFTCFVYVCWSLFVFFFFFIQLCLFIIILPIFFPLFSLRVRQPYWGNMLKCFVLKKGKEEVFFSECYGLIERWYSFLYKKRVISMCCNLHKNLSPSFHVFIYFLFHSLCSFLRSLSFLLLSERLICHRVGGLRRNELISC